MKLKLLEKAKDKIVFEVSGETHTFLNLLRENAWKVGSEQASYVIEHPYLSEPRFIVKADNPAKILSDASQRIIDQAKEFGKEFKRVSR
jgi:DNA-directed RNA polymerase subunit L